MGCKLENGTKCCFDCNITHCPDRCYGYGRDKMHKECDKYVDKKYECIYEKNENLIRCVKCYKSIKEGYSMDNGSYHYCSERCLYKDISEEEYLELHKKGYAFWTKF